MSKVISARKRVLTLILSILILILYIGSSALSYVYAENSEQKPEKIRIGFFPSYGMSKDSSYDELSGFTYDYFEEIAKYTNFEYEYVPCTWGEGLSMLENGEIDIFGPMQKTDAREKIFSFTDMNFGYEYIALYALNQSNIFYNDFEFFDGMKVGIEFNSPHINIMNSFCTEYDINIEYVTTSGDDILGDLKNGLYDVFLSGSLLDIDETKVVEKIGVLPFYYAIKKDNVKLLNQLNYALRAIHQENFDFCSQLFEKYYGSKSISIPDFTKEETEIINQFPSLSVAVTVPIDSVDPQTGNISGMTVDVLELISKQCGIKFNYSLYKDNTNADIQVISNINTNSDKNSRTTTEFLSSPVVLIQKAEKSADDSDDNIDKSDKIAVPITTFPDVSTIMRKYPGAQILEYKTSVEAMRALKKGEVDMAVSSLYIFSCLVKTENLQNYIAVPTDLKFNVKMRVSENLPEKMIGILNKSIKRVPQDEVNSAMFSSSIKYYKENAFLGFIKRNTVPIILVIILFVVLIILNISKSKRKLLQKAAYYDSVTGLPTILKFKDDITEILKTAKPDEYMIVAIDIDKFAYINNLLGYKTGNTILKITAEHLKSRLSPKTYIAREMSDIFLFFLKTKELNEFVCKDNDIIKKLEPILGIDYPLSFSIGVFVINDTNEDIMYMIDKANCARKYYKNSYKTSFTKYTYEMEQEFLKRRRIHLNMAQGLSRNEFILYLHAKTDLRTHKIKGAEVLVRWHTQDGDILSPNDFIPLFEANGFIYQLDLYMFEKTCQILHMWEKEQITNIPRLSVNISKKTLHTDGLCNSLLYYVSKYKINMRHIELELTESAFSENKKKTIEIISHLKSVGFIISLDDFGSGYSSFNMLKNIDIDVIKIDKEFLEHSLMNERGNKIIHSIIDLAKTLDIETVAEGVETEEQAELLTGFGCNLAQGFYFAKPLDISSFDINCFGFIPEVEEPEDSTQTQI